MSDPTASTPVAHLLVVDDSAFFRQFLGRVLSKAGYRVTLTDRGDTALGYLRSDPEDFQILLTDVQMPHMDGRELARRARELQPDLGVLLMSGAWVPAQEAAEDPTTPFLPKPFTYWQLLEALEAIADGPSASASH